MKAIRRKRFHKVQSIYVNGGRIYYNHKEYNQTRTAMRAQLKDALLGMKCFFCPRKDNLAAHRKDGRKHRSLSYMGEKNLRRELETGDYVRLCRECHISAHWATRMLKLSWDELVAAVKEAA